jgi:tetratricopeptide (TPR) repeat protein
MEAAMSGPIRTRFGSPHQTVAAALLLALYATPFPAAAHNESAKLAPGDLRSAGAVEFPISCNPAGQAEFNRAAALLHSFFYEEARNIFTRVAEQDPACAMAQWGIAQSWWHPIWAPPTPEEMKAGTAAAEKAMALASSGRERLFIEAINTYYKAPPPKVEGEAGQSCHGPIGPRERVLAYEGAMKKVRDAHPKDLEVQVFYAFAVLSVGYATPLDTTLANQKQAGKMLEKLWKKHRRHPGIVHYIIHSYDYPGLATQALDAAKVYADIAPWVPHALHMPSHIFTRLGMWDDAIEGNAAAAQAQNSYSQLQGRTAMDTQELHALDYMMYSYLQQARDTEAKKVLDRVAAVRATFPETDFVGAYALAAVPARFALERNAWQEAARLPVASRRQWEANPFTEGLIEYARALGSARTGDTAGARKALKRMAALRDATTDVRWTYFKKHLELQMQAASAWLAHAEGRSEEAVTLLRTVADAEDALGKHPVTPGALVPAREQLGELLLMLQRPQDALPVYEAGLKIYPARFNSLYGAALSAERMGNRRLARRHYETLAKQAAKADVQRAELTHAKEYLAAAAGPVKVASE